MKKLNMIIIFLLLLFIPVVCSAEENGCTYKYRAELSKIAKNVNASYEIKQNSSGSYYLEITINNIVDGVYVTYNYTSKNIRGNTVTVFPTDTTDGTYKITQYDINNVYKYSFKVGGTEYACSSYAKSFTLTVPMYNTFSDLPECQYYAVSDYLYCQQWVTTKFNITETEAKKKIQKQLDNSQKTTTTAVVQADDFYSQQYERLMKLWKYTIIGLSIGVVVDIALIIFLYIRLKEYLIFDI